MPRTISEYQIFIASPGDLDNERQIISDLISEFNTLNGDFHGIKFCMVGWEDIPGGRGAPQDRIDERLKACDYVILMFWEKWGSAPNEKCTSGTESEYKLADDCISSVSSPLKDMLILFKTLDGHKMVHPEEQLQQVINFRKMIEQEKKYHYDTFDSIDRLGYRIRLYLNQTMHSIISGSRSIPVVHDSNQSDYSPQLIKYSNPESEEHATHLQHAWSLANKGEVTEAEIQFLKLSIGSRNSTPSINYGAFLLRQGRLKQSLMIFEQSIIFAKNEGNPLDERIAHNNAGVVNLDLSQLREAKQHFLLASSSNTPAEPHELDVAVFNNMGLASLSENRLTIAENFIRKALQIAQDNGFVKDLGRVLGSLGILADKRDHDVESESIYKQSIEIEEKLDNQASLATQLGNYGNLLLKQKCFEQALEMYKRSQSICDNLGLIPVSATNNTMIGVVLYQQDKVEQTIEYFEKALCDYESSQMLNEAANICLRLVKVYRSQENFKQLIQRHSRAIELYETLGDNLRAADESKALGDFLETIDDISNGTAFLNKAVHHNISLGRVEQLAHCLSAIGLMNLKRDKLSNVAEEYFLEAVENYAAIENFQELARCYGNLSILWKNRNNVAKSSKYCKLALSAARKQSDLDLLATFEKMEKTIVSFVRSHPS